MGDQMCRAWEDFLAAECSERPLLLILEDLHWGDLPSVQFIDAALRNLPDQPLMVLALARSEVHDVFPGIWSQRGLSEIRLRGLSRRAGEKLVRQVLGPSVSAEVTAALVDRAAGNAFYLEELIRAVAEGEPGALPETVLAVIEARLSSLDAPSRLALRAASVFGQAFWAGGVRALVSGEGRTADVGARLRDLSQRELISRRPAGRFQGDEEYVFRHALVREAAYAMLTDADRALGHRLAGDWLERAGEHQAAVLAEHFERGGDAERAIGWHRRAAEQAQEANDLGAAIALADRAIALGAAGEVRGALRLVQAEAHMWRGDNEAARRSAEGALSDLPKEGPRWIAAAGEAAVACSRLSDKGALVALGAELQRLSSASAEGPVSSAEVTHAQIISAARVAIQLLFSGQTEMADALLANLERGASAASERDPAALGWIHRARAWRALFEGDPAAYLTLSEAAAERFKAAGDERSVSNARMNMAYACFQMGDPEQAARARRDGGRDAADGPLHGRRGAQPRPRARARGEDRGGAVGGAVGRRGIFKTDEPAAARRRSALPGADPGDGEPAPGGGGGGAARGGRGAPRRIRLRARPAHSVILFHPVKMRSARAGALSFELVAPRAVPLEHRNEFRALSDRPERLRHLIRSSRVAPDEPVAEPRRELVILRDDTQQICPLRRVLRLRVQRHVIHDPLYS
jgi:tetratricopeptide (TPR) repeat protein